MKTNFTVKAYYTFMCLLPLIFYSGIIDTVLLPRQLLLSIFTLILAIPVWKSIRNSKDNVFKIDGVHLAMVVYLFIAAIVSFLNAVVFSEAMYGLSKLWIVISLSLSLRILLKNNVIATKQIINGVILFGCLAIATALLDIAHKTMQGANLLHWVYTISGGFGNKNLLSSILFICFPFFCIGMHQKGVFKTTSIVAILLALFILIILRTRAVLVATVIYFSIILLFLLKAQFKNRFWLLISTFFTMAVLVIVAFAKLNASPIIEVYVNRLLDSRTIGERMLFWKNSVAMLYEHPFGVGLGNWQIYFPKYGLDQFSSFDMINGIQTLQRPHNDFLWSLCETGVFGFVAYLSIFGILIYQSLKLLTAAKDAYEKRLFTYMFSGIIGFILISFFDFPMERIEHMVILIVLFSIVIQQYGTKFGYGFTFPKSKLIVLLFIVSGACFSFIVAFNRFAAEKQVYQLYASRATNDTAEQFFFIRQAEGFFYNIDSKTIPLEWYKGVAQFSKQQYLESEISFERAYLLTPYNIHVMNNLASCYEVNGKRKEAMKLYKKALRISPRFEEARLNLAAVYFNNKDYEKAFQTIDSCSIETRDPKYKIFLPPILKSKANLMIDSINFPISVEGKNILTNVQDYSNLYYQSKKNNITFEQQIINHLNK